ncbi:MAG TPA: helicase C-terminal domain-containing protein [Vicinamibacterales bacterium]|nr:helicase C-terminal domain-containing protein [Vicinamibacterales bacterium]
MPEVPAVPGGVKAGLKSCATSATDTLTARVAAVFAPGGPLARTVPDFEPRTGQVEMAGAVARTFERGGVLLAEAGTGTGKTLAYLVPAILSRERVLISTGTKNLQEQIYFKDIPALRAALDIPFTATYMKGRANFLCLHRLDRINDGAGPPVHDVFLPMVREWATRTETGDRAELEDLPEDLAFWNEVSATAETCLGTECPRYDECFVTKMRQRAASSDVVIVNHHLLCADAAVRQNAYGEVIPACHHAILDEAHQVEDIATQYFGFSVSTYRLEELARDAERLAASGVIDDRKTRDEVAKAIERLRARAHAFFTELAYAHRTTDRVRGEERVRATSASLANAGEAGAHLTSALDIIESTFALLRKGRLKPDTTESAADDDDKRSEDLAALVRRAGELRTELRFLLRASDDEYVYFVEFRGRGIFLRASPIDVSGIIRDVLLDKMRTTVLTSATLTVDGAFDYIRDRLGIVRAEQVRLPSEFDFREQAILYLPQRMPDPRSADFPLAAGREVIAILKRTEGRAFVLFTSYASLRAVQAIAEMALHYPIFSQGSAPRSQLLKQFRETPHAVLFATSSFWQGVDVIGEALSCVIVDKLPFASPGDPITQARIESIRARGGDPFGEYQVPLAILALQQGLGRLIRHRNDRGVLAVLDPRLRTKGYGRRFVASLPPAPVVHDLARIDAFFSR